MRKTCAMIVGLFVPVAGRSFRLALSHNAVIDRALDGDFEAYAAEMVDFVAYRSIDRLFVMLMDYTQPKYGYSKPELVAEHLLNKLPHDQEVCALLYILPKDAPWSNSPSAPGGFCHNGVPSSIVPTVPCSAQANDTSFPAGCPNYIEQAALYLADVNTQSTGAKISCVSFDGECMGEYASPDGMCQISAALEKVGISDFGMEKAAAVTPKSTGGTAAYPELYWIGELGKDPSKWVDTIYTRHKNQPQDMLDAFSQYLEPYVSSFTQPGTWPMFSFEYLESPGESTCIQREYKGEHTDAICGTFNGFGTWDWEPFEQFLELFATKYGVHTIAIYEWQFVPDSWKRTSPSPPITTTSPSPSPITTTSPSGCMEGADVTCSADSDCMNWLQGHGCPTGSYGYCKDNGHCVLKFPQALPFAI